MSTATRTPWAVLPLAFAGGTMGTGLRMVSHALGDALHAGPWIPTLCVNVIASFVAGCLGRLLLGHLTRRQALTADAVDPFEARSHRHAMLFITGFCGGLSTFSALGVEVHDLLRQQRMLESVVAMTLSMALGITAAWAGLRVGERMTRHR